MRILHAPIQIAGFGSLMARELRGLGFDAQSWSPAPDYLGWAPDQVLDLSNARGAARAAVAACRWLGSDDVLHLSFGRGFFPNLSDLGVLANHCRTFVSFFGSDARLASLAAEQCPTAKAKAAESWVDAQLRALAVHPVIPIAHEHRLAVGLRRYFRCVLVCPVGIDLSLHPTCSPPSRARVRIAHAPTWPEGKGTQHVVEAVRALFDEGLPVELDLIEGVSHEQCRTRMADADIVVDQLLDGSPGAVTYEALHSGRAVVVNTCRAYLDTLPGAPPPVHHATPDTVRDVLRGLVLDGALRATQGGPDWVRAHHDHRVQARVLAKLYRNEVFLPICGVRPLWPEVAEAAKEFAS